MNHNTIARVLAGVLLTSPGAACSDQTTMPANEPAASAEMASGRTRAIARLQLPPASNPKGTSRPFLDSLSRELVLQGLRDAQRLRSRLLIRGKRNHRERFAATTQGNVFERIVTARGNEPFSRLTEQVNGQTTRTIDFKWRRTAGRFTLSAFTMTVGPEARIRVAVDLVEAARRPAERSEDCEWVDGEGWLCYEASYEVVNDVWISDSYEGQHDDAVYTSDYVEDEGDASVPCWWELRSVIGHSLKAAGLAAAAQILTADCLAGTHTSCAGVYSAWVALGEATDRLGEAYAKYDLCMQGRMSAQSITRRRQ